MCHWPWGYDVVMTIPKRTRICVLVLLNLAAAGSLFGQQNTKPAAVAAAPKNLKILAADGDLMDAMRGFNEALGVQCVYCHVAGDFAADGNSRKETARRMIAMVRQLEPLFVSTGGVFPRGYHEVDCVTCHRGKAKPETKSPTHFLNARDAAGVVPPEDPATNLKVLAAGTKVHGEGSVMEDFRDALNVDCGYCHGAPGGFALDTNPRKDTARRMIEMLRRINANFPGTGVYPQGTQVVSCYTCHRGDPHPTSLSNKRYEASPAPVP
jgi:hypothetical protein